MEVHLKEIVAAFYFKLSQWFGIDTSYTGGLSSQQIEPFLPVLTEIAINSSPCPTTAQYLLDVFEIVNLEACTPFLNKISVKWAADADRQFWNKFGIGQRIYSLVADYNFDPNSIDQWIIVADAISESGNNAGEELKSKLEEIRSNLLSDQN